MPWFVVGVVVAPAVVEAAGEAAVALGGGATLAGFVDVVDLREPRWFIAAGVEAHAVTDLDGSVERAGEEPAGGADVDDP